MSSTTTSAPSASSTNRVQQVEIPSSTVLAIGLGFVGFVAALLISSCGIRVLRVRRRVAAQRAAGQHSTFTEAWEREGGMFGFFSSFTASGALTVGAGGSAHERLEALMRGQRGWGTGTEKELPLLYDVPIKEKTDIMDDAEGDSAYQPFALSSTIAPKYIDRSKPIADLPEPLFTLSLLIALPSESKATALNVNTAQASIAAESEEWPDIPELLIGTTQVCPMIMDTTPANQETVSKRSPNGVDKDLEGKIGGKDSNIIQEIEHKPAGMRRARWERVETIKWQIEGLR